MGTGEAKTADNDAKDPLANAVMTLVGAMSSEAERKERLERLGQKRLAHEALLKRDFPLHGKELISMAHKCGVGWCGKPGTLSSAITGNGNYFCQEHFRRD